MKLSIETAKTYVKERVRASLTGICDALSDPKRVTLLCVPFGFIGYALGIELGLVTVLKIFTGFLIGALIPFEYVITRLAQVLMRTFDRKGLAELVELISNTDRIRGEFLVNIKYQEDLIKRFSAQDPWSPAIVQLRDYIEFDKRWLQTWTDSRDKYVELIKVYYRLDVVPRSDDYVHCWTKYMEENPQKRVDVGELTN